MFYRMFRSEVKELLEKKKEFISSTSANYEVYKEAEYELEQNQHLWWNVFMQQQLHD